MEHEKMMERIEKGIQYRNVHQIELRENADGECKVEGYASTFNQPYNLYSWSDYEVNEQIDPHAFDECDMSDVIFQYNHEGRVFARTRNSTLEVKVDSKGLYCQADLGGTVEGRNLYEEIKGGYTDRMSFGFVVDEDKREITEDKEHGKTTVLRTITKIGKLYDVSAVSIPANDNTDISARSYATGIVEKLKEEARERRANIERVKAEAAALLNL